MVTRVSSTYHQQLYFLHVKVKYYIKNTIDYGTI